jgi:hypothetical protein
VTYSNEAAIFYRQKLTSGRHPLDPDIAQELSWPQRAFKMHALACNVAAHVAHETRYRDVLRTLLELEGLCSRAPHRSSSVPKFSPATRPLLLYRRDTQIRQLVNVSLPTEAVSVRDSRLIRPSERTPQLGINPPPL